MEVALSNAERQRRYRNRLKQQARSRLVETVREACAQWLDDVEAEAVQEDDPETLRRVAALRNNPVDEQAVEFMIGQFMEHRLRSVRISVRAPRRGARRVVSIAEDIGSHTTDDTDDTDDFS